MLPLWQLWLPIVHVPMLIMAAQPTDGAWILTEILHVLAPQ